MGFGEKSVYSRKILGCKLPASYLQDLKNSSALGFNLSLPGQNYIQSLKLLILRVLLERLGYNTQGRGDITPAFCCLSIQERSRTHLETALSVLYGLNFLLDVGGILVEILCLSKLIESLLEIS